MANIIRIGGGGDSGVADALIMRELTEYSSDKVDDIGEFAFSGCSSLTTVDLPAAKSISSSAFSTCLKLQSATLTAAAYIYGYAFLNCQGLQSIELPAAKAIYGGAFQGCIALTALVLANTSGVCTLGGTNVFTNTPIASGTGYIYVPDSLVDSYKAATNWSTYANQIKPLSEYTG